MYVFEAVQHVVIPVLARDRANGGHVAARTRFRHAKRCDLLASERGDQELLDLLLGSKVANGPALHMSLWTSSPMVVPAIWQRGSSSALTMLNQ